MSLDSLRADMKRNALAADRLSDLTRDYMQSTVWPFLEALVDEIAEMDDAVAELVDQQEDYLQPETAGVFAAVVQSSLQLAVELKRRANGDQAVLKLVSNHEQICQQVSAILGEITMVPVDDEEEDEDDEDQAAPKTGPANE